MVWGGWTSQSCPVHPPPELGFPPAEGEGLKHALGNVGPLTALKSPPAHSSALLYSWVSHPGTFSRSSFLDSFCCSPNVTSSDKPSSVTHSTDVPPDITPTWVHTHGHMHTYSCAYTQAYVICILAHPYQIQLCTHSHVCTHSHTHI